MEGRQRVGVVGATRKTAMAAKSCEGFFLQNYLLRFFQRETCFSTKKIAWIQFAVALKARFVKTLFNLKPLAFSTQFPTALRSFDKKMLVEICRTGDAK